MSATQHHRRLTLVAIEDEPSRRDLATAVREGLTGEPKSIPCRFFYDAAGSRLFERICELPEYYLTRAEHEILVAHACELAAEFAAPVDLVELGSGSATKTRVVIEAFLARHGRLRYMPVDISRSVLEESATALLEHYPALEIHAIAAEYHAGLRALATGGGRRRLVLWLGSNVGNFERTAAAAFLRGVRRRMSGDDRMLIGIDLRKDRATLERAYDDAAGVTAAFNKNLLARVNAELGADFDLAAFRHRAIYDEECGRIAMELVSVRAQSVAISDLGLTVRFAAGEALHTEYSYKYSGAEIDALAHASGFATERSWTDAAARFRVSLFAPA